MLIAVFLNAINPQDEIFVWILKGSAQMKQMTSWKDGRDIVEDFWPAVITLYLLRLPHSFSSCG
jgi:hypothetical protein